MAHHPTETNLQVVNYFETFFNGWLIRQQNYLEQLLLAITPENVHQNEQYKSLIDQVLFHYRQYYEEKSQAAREDVYLFLSPPWLSSFERTFLWVGGFKPSLVFKLLEGSVKDLTEEQKSGIEQVKSETRREERELTEAMAMIQESMAARPMMMLARHGAENLVDGEISEVESAMEALQTKILVVLDAADGLRGTTVRKVMQILHPVQTVKLLAGAAQLQLRVRRSGLLSDQQRATTGP